MVKTENLLPSESGYLMGMVIKVSQVQNIFNQESCMKGKPVKNRQREDAKRVMFLLLPKVKTELERLEGEDITEKVTHKTLKPERAWQKIGTDIFTLKERNYFIAICYFLHYREITRLEPLTSANVIVKLKNMFARLGVPYEVISFNGTQFTGTSFSDFASKYGLTHSAVSPHFPQVNRTVQSGVSKRLPQQILSWL